jgi:hypothetical protein
MALTTAYDDLESLVEERMPLAESTRRHFSVDQLDKR